MRIRLVGRLALYGHTEPLPQLTGLALAAPLEVRKGADLLSMSMHGASVAVSGAARRDAPRLMLCVPRITPPSPARERATDCHLGPIYDQQ